MDSSQEVNDDSSRSRVLGRLVLCKCPVCQEHSESRTRVGFEHVHDGLSRCLDLLGTDRCKDAVVDGIVQEQHLGRLNEDGCQREQVVVDEYVYTGSKHAQYYSHYRTGYVVSEDSNEHSDNTYREVVDKHFEAGRHSGFHEAVKLLDDPARERSHDHGAHQHRLSFSSADTGNSSHYCNGAHDTTAVSAYHSASCKCYQSRKQVREHVWLNGCKLLIWQPSIRNE